MNAIATERNIEIMIVMALSVFSISPVNSEFGASIVAINEAPSNSKTIETVVEVGSPSELKRSSRKTSLITTARYIHITVSKLNALGLNIPCRATSIMPLLNEAPIKTPTAATMSTCLIFAALEPTAELKKFTASLLTPTVRSIIASVNMNAMTKK